MEMESGRGGGERETKMAGNIAIEKDMETK